MTYTVAADPLPHVCPNDQTRLYPEYCPGCAQAATHPCRWCAYGDIFTTHNSAAHDANGDPCWRDVQAASLYLWRNAPHEYAHDHPAGFLPPTPVDEEGDTLRVVPLRRNFHDVEDASAGRRRRGTSLPPPLTQRNTSQDKGGR